MSDPLWRAEPNAPAVGTHLCRLDEVPTDNGLEVVFGEGAERFRMVLFRLPDDSGRPVLRAYVNVCPHAGIPFNYQPEVFCVYDIDGQRDLMCMHHAALFHLVDGRCYEGPCTGQSLQSMAIRITDQVVTIAPPA